MNYFDSIYSDNLPSRAVHVYMYLVNRANTDGQCWPSVRRIAKDLSLSPSTVKRAIEDLTSHGYIKIEQRFRKSGANSSLMFTVPDFSKYRTPKGYEDECFYRRMTERNRFGQFDFQVTNHQLFLTSARMRYEEQHPLLIDSDLVIIDEAHKLHDAALDAMGDQLAENEIKRYVSAVGHLNSNPKKIELYKAILAGLLTNSEKLFGSAKQKAGYDDTDSGRSQMIELNPEDITLIEALIADIRHIERMRKEEPRHLKNRAGLLIKKLSSFKNQSGNNIWIETDENRLHSISSALDVALEEFKTLQARLNEIDEPLDSFDPKLFEEVIKGMTVNNRDDMAFRLIGDLTFTVRL